MDCTCELSRIRIGNTFEVAREILTNGEPISLVGRRIYVELTDPRGKQVKTRWRIDPEHDTVIRFTFEGMEQKTTGIYCMTVYENRGLNQQALFDQPIFILVPKTSLQNIGIQDFVHPTLDLAGGGLMVGGRDGVGIASIDFVESSTTADTYRITLTDETHYDFSARRGSYCTGLNVKYQVQSGTAYWMNFSDGTRYEIFIPCGPPGPEGPRGERGEPGLNGRTPVRGVDYWTEADKNVIIREVKNTLEHQIPTNTSQLVNDSGFVSDSDFVHTDENYTTAEKTKLAGIAEGAQQNYVKNVEDYSNTAIPANLNKLLSQGGITLKMGSNGLLGLMVNTGGTVGNSGAGTRQFVTGQAVYEALVRFAQLASPAFTGTPTAPTAPDGTNNTQIATTEFVNKVVAAAQGETSSMKGVVNSNSDISSLTDYKPGWRWVVQTAGTYVGQSCEVGDVILCLNNYSYGYAASDFTVLQANLALHEITEAEIDAICV